MKGLIGLGFFIVQKMGCWDNPGELGLSAGEVAQFDPYLDWEDQEAALQAAGAIWRGKQASLDICYE